MVQGNCRVQQGFAVLIILLVANSAPVRAEADWQLQVRSQVATNPQRSHFQRSTETVHWDPEKTAVVICDMWDQHWCQGASRRVAEMAPRMNKVVKSLREKGVLIIHCPSSCMEFYRDHPARRRAQQAPEVKTSIPLQSWCHLDPSREGPLPIDDSDGGCDCDPQCPTGSPWTRQIHAIEISAEDAITDRAEAYYLMKDLGIENVLVMGVHTNMCVLGRPFSIRQLVYQGLNVVLVRDLTDTMYNSRMPPFVPHHEGTKRVIAHIERYWCPTVTSAEFDGGPEFRFRDDRP
jgi:nicotinamidase-related amidase